MGITEEFDMVVISKTGKIGEIYEIENLKIALPKRRQVLTKSEDKKWKPLEYSKRVK